MKVTALLPLKEHSERVPNKNIRIFAGKPLYHHIAKVLQSSDHIESILVDTDSEIIAAEAVNFFSKVKIIIRPVELRGDFVPMNEIIEHDLNFAESDHILQTHSTNPLLTTVTLETAIKQYFDSIPQFDSLFSVTKIQNRFFWESGKPVNHDPNKLLRTQDLSPLFEENSNIYLFSKKSFSSSKKNRIGPKPKMFVMSKLESIDIDDMDDWKLAEALYKSKNK
ncbi:MAG: acylneuraminate cytidylyltransferase family protein [Desulfobacteraceae bacterium]|jgi:CMP-N-acetylneuraminic acid synthetase